MSQQINSNIDGRIVKHFKKVVKENEDSMQDGISKAMQIYIQKYRRTN